MILEKSKKFPREGISKILIRGTNWIGDAVLTLPAVASIRASYPSSFIAVLTKPWVADIYRIFSAVDEVIIYEKKYDSPTGVFRLAWMLKKYKFDAAILLQNAVEAAIIASFAGIPIRGGYNSDGRGLLLTHGVKRTREIKAVHQIAYYQEMVKALGCIDIGREMHLETKINPFDAQKTIQKFIPGENKEICGIAPGAVYGPAKRWFPERFGALADMIEKSYNLQGVLFGGKADWEAAEETRKSAKSKLVNIAGKTNLQEAIHLISQCRLFVSNDSGLMHVAGALNVPTVAIFGSTNPVTTSPAGEKTIIVRQNVSCSPCLEKTCPTDFQCMKLVSVEDVFAAAKNILGKQ